MQSNYKPLGNYIQELNVRNTALEVDLLLGVSIQKKLMPSIANTIGTNMATYKIIKRNQFAYGPVTSRNGNKISIALLDEFDEAIISQAYTPFEITDTNKLHPEYLMMWFRRPEFDRYARFMSHGSAREIFGWDEMCNTLLPIPSPEKQREIVGEYNVIQNRIKINNQLIQKLEETAQTIYKQWFVDFEFPNAYGKPYKSSGGKMVFNEEFKKEIPIGWKNIAFEKVASVIDPHPSHRAPAEVIEGFPFAGIGDIDYFGNINTSQARLIGEDSVASKQEQDYEIDQHTIGYGRVGTVGKVVKLRKQKFRYALSPTMAVINPKEIANAGFVFYSINNNDFYKRVTTDMTGSTRPAIGIQLLRKIEILQPNSKHQSVLDAYNKLSSKIIKASDNFGLQNYNLMKLKELLLSKLATIEN